MSGNKTIPTDANVDVYIEGVTPVQKARDTEQLDSLFRQVTGFQPKTWGASIIGYGRYHYKYKSGRDGDFLATGFSPRKANFSIYIMPGYQNYDPILARLGKHKTGKFCLYISKLADVDLQVLGELIGTGLKDLDAIWPVQPE